MGWWEDFAHPIGRTVTQAAAAVVNTTVAAVTAPVNLVVDVASGRDIGESLEDHGGRLAGAVVSSVTSGYGLMQTDLAQEGLRNETVSQLTLGYTENYAGLNTVTANLQAGAEVSQDDWNKAGRWFMQTGAAIATVATGAVAAGDITLQNYITAQAGSAALARGDVKSLANLAGIPGPIAGLLPSNPATPPRTPQVATPTQPQTPSADYWGSNGGAVGNSFGAFGMSTETLILTGAAIAAGLILSRRL